jgi:hypothetical protein
MEGGFSLNDSTSKISLKRTEMAGEIVHNPEDGEKTVGKYRLTKFIGSGS